MSKLRFAVIGAGFWSHFQLAGWYELGGVECVAVCDRVLSKAEALAQKFGVPTVYDDAEQLVKNEQLDFIDIVSDVFTHEPFVRLAAAHNLPVICQKPMAPTFAAAEGMVERCRQANVPFFVHENFRWQTPMRHLKQVLDDGLIGKPFRARIDMVSGFPVFVNQPFLRELEQFVLTDVGVHVLDLARFFFGEASGLYCQTQRIHQDVKGEDIASVMLKMQNGMTVQCQMGYAENYLEHDHFPQTFLFIEGDKGSVELGPDYWIRVTTEGGTHARRYAPPRYAWADPAYDVVHASIVDCNANLLSGIQHLETAETTGADNLETLRLVFKAYESAAQNAFVML